KDRNFRVSEKAILLGLLGGYFIHNIFVFDHLISYILFFSFLAYLHASGGREKSFLGEKTLSQMGNMIAGAIVIVVLVLTIWFVNVPAMQTAYAVIQAISPQEGGPVENLKWHKRANEINFIGRQEATEQLLLAAETVARGTNDQELRSTFFEAARSEMLEELERNPNDARTQVLMGSFLNNFNRTQESLGYIERAHELSPMKQQISFLLGLTHIANGNEEKALPLFKEAFESAPQYEEARQMYVVALVYNREFVLADQVLAEYYGADVLPNNQRLLQAYHSVGRFDKVVDIWELRANLNPQDAQTRVSLAAAYYQAGRPQEAIEILRQVIAQVPSFKEQGEELIRQIQAGTL
ncbi:MAG: tetratricopeptide repeat protein, partial [Candidatus Paceibacterota bacterium]